MGHDGNSAAITLCHLVCHPYSSTTECSQDLIKCRCKLLRVLLSPPLRDKQQFDMVNFHDPKVIEADAGKFSSFLELRPY